MALDPVKAVREELAPLFDQLIDILRGDQNADAATEFGQMAILLARCRTEEDLIELFVEHLALAAPIAAATGCSVQALDCIDTLLARAQQISFAFSADPSRPN